MSTLQNRHQRLQILLSFQSDRFVTFQGEVVYVRLPGNVRSHNPFYKSSQPPWQPMMLANFSHREPHFLMKSAGEGV